jgi:hypothetical protein
MKRIIVTLCLFVSCLLSNGQESNQLNEMIISSINSYIDWKNDFVKRGISMRDTCHHYICKDGLPANFPYAAYKTLPF